MKLRVQEAYWEVTSVKGKRRKLVWVEKPSDHSADLPTAQSLQWGGPEKDCPLGEFCIGWRLPIFGSTILLSHWLRLPQVECDLGSKAEGNLKELTARHCQLTSQSLEGVLFFFFRGCTLCSMWDPSSPARGWTHTPWRGRAVLITALPGKSEEVPSWRGNWDTQHLHVSHTS